MKILSIGTSGVNCTVAITEDDKLINEINNKNELSHSQNLMPSIKNILEKTNLELKDIDAYACSIGPGSFTGIRIGVATIKGFCLGANKKVFAVPSLLALAYNVKDFDGYIVACIDAKNENIYSAIYKNSDSKIEMIGDYIVDNYKKLIEEIKKLNDKIIIVGDGKNLLKNDLKDENLEIIYAEDKYDFEYAKNIANAGYDMYKEGKSTTGVMLSPLYLKKSQAERELENKDDNN